MPQIIKSFVSWLSRPHVTSNLDRQSLIYRTRAIIGRSRFEAALVYKPQILGLNNEEFLFLVHKLSVL